MQMTLPQLVAAATKVRDICNSIKAAEVRTSEFSRYNGYTDPGWGTLSNASNPDLIDANGYIIGTNFKPVDISNAIGSLNNFLHFYAGDVAVLQSAWGQNIEILSDPIV